MMMTCPIKLGRREKEEEDQGGSVKEEEGEKTQEVKKVPEGGLVLIFFCCCCCNTHAHTHQSSQFFSSSFVRGPIMTGIVGRGGLRVEEEEEEEGGMGEGGRHVNARRGKRGKRFPCFEY